MRVSTSFKVVMVYIFKAPGVYFIHANSYKLNLNEELQVIILNQL